MADVRTFRALRYDEAVAGPLPELVAPPYDVISPGERDELRQQSPYNVVHLTLPDGADAAARALETWRADGAVIDDGPAAWTLSQEYVGPDGVARTRNGRFVSLHVEPYERRLVLPHERTHRAPKEERLRILRATRVQLEPIFLLHDGPTVELPATPPELAAADARLWRSEEDPASLFADAELLIADGHHRYETALAFHAEDGTEESAFLPVVLVSTKEEGLTIFPTHRLVSRVPSELTTSGGESVADVDAALQLLAAHDGPAYAIYDGELRVYATPGRHDESTVEYIHRFDLGDVSYTPDAREAVGRVDAGAAHAAVLVAPTPLERVFELARRGEVMPQKSTYFFPKLVSGLLFQPL